MVKEGPVNKKEAREEPELADFIDFFNDENLIVNDPVFSKEAVEQYFHKKNKIKKACSICIRIKGKIC